MYSSSRDRYAGDIALSLVEAVRALSGPGYSHAERLQAINVLAEAPPEPVWDRAIVGALSLADPELRAAAADACLRRIHWLSNPDERDAFIECLLTHSFRDISAAGEDTRALIIQRVTDFLLADPTQHDHHRSRLLSLSDQIAYVPDQPVFAAEVVRSQQRFADESDRSDAQVVMRLDRQRRFSLFRTPGVSQDSLLAYLTQDAGMPAEQLTRAWLIAYRDLHRIQQKSRQALELSLRNLVRWLDETPQDLERRCALTGDVQRARVGVPWEELAPLVQVHLLAHQELVPGPDDPDDLLQLIRNRYTHPGAEPIAAAGFDVLGRLPGLRGRATELCEYLADEGMRSLGTHAWTAALGAIGRLITGLSPVEVNAGPLDDARRRRAKVRDRALASDEVFRAFLRRLSLDSTYPEAVRLEAWRVLLCSLPPERLEYFTDGLSEPDGLLFLPTLEHIARTLQRDGWSVAARHWAQIVAGSPDDAARRQRLFTVCETLARLRSYDTVGRKGTLLAPLLSLALDDPDAAVREKGTEAVHEAGYTAELERELQRRELERLRHELTQSGARIIGHEETLNQLSDRVTTVRSRKSDLALAAQGLLLERDHLVTDGWLFATRTQVNLAEVQAELLRAVAQAEDAERYLQGLQQQMQQYLAECVRAHQRMEGLVSEARQCEARITQLEQQIRWEESQAQSCLSRANSISDPTRGYSSDPDQQRSLDSQYQSECNSRAAERSALRSQAAGHQSAAAAYAGQLAGEVARLAILQSRIHALRQECEQLRQMVEALDAEFQVRRASYEELRQRIARLNQKAESIRAAWREHQQQQEQQLRRTAAELDANRVATNSAAAELLLLGENINSTRDALVMEHTHSQQLNQGIEQGRRHYDELSERAVAASAATDTRGASEQAVHEARVLEIDESLVFYALDVEGALEKRRAEAAPRPVIRQPSAVREGATR